MCARLLHLGTLLTLAVVGVCCAGEQGEQGRGGALSGGENRDAFGEARFAYLINGAYRDRATCQFASEVKPHAVRRESRGRRRGAWRFELRPGDLSCVDLNSGGQQLGKSRSEVGQAPGSLDFGVPYWFSWSFLIEPGSSAPAKGQGVIIGQIHGGMNAALTEQSPSPIANWQYNADGTLSFQTLSSSNPDATFDDVRVRHHFRSKSPIVLGKCYRIVQQIRFDWRGDGVGFVNAWLDGQKVVSYVGPIGNNDREGPYLRMGAYSAASSTRFAIWYRDFKFGRGISGLKRALTSSQCDL